eukprot:CAMPEP_0184643574 /NCGR_PEP_ID=MMETSP0308-20130426/415_1 /TAXON_ID=38269 /ORGANISM="Gloeochaete witrockiana, Strain SAG 46.84" /LENGTH=73 /DNA_ID=CAMNT_0027071595 /DNA_START=1085 /DNA_END=1306 /DNA_ORIENTATION=-
MEKTKTKREEKGKNNNPEPIDPIDVKQCGLFAKHASPSNSSQLQGHPRTDKKPDIHHLEMWSGSTSATKSTLE